MCICTSCWIKCQRNL